MSTISQAIPTFNVMDLYSDLSPQLAAALDGLGEEIKNFIMGDFSYIEKAHGNLGTNTTFNYTDGNWHSFTPTAAFTISIGAYPVAGKPAILLVYGTNPGLYTVTDPAGTDWGAAGAPTLPASGNALWAYYTPDGGTTTKGKLLWSD